MAIRFSAVAVALAIALPAGHAWAYEGDVHQQLTFIAARQYNRCAEDTHLARLTSLQVRYVALANANQAESPWWQRMFRWDYYDRGDQSAGRVLWMFETRMHDRYDSAIRRLNEARDLSRRFTNLGRVVNHVQDVTTPSQVAPVFAMRWWRFSVADRFSTYPVNTGAVQRALGDDCTAVRGSDGALESLLVDTADRTLDSIVEPIRGMPSTWEAFWELDNDLGEFGRYGDAGNSFGRDARFRCTEDESRQCVLLARDPIYAEYARDRHLDAVKATMTAIAIVQEQFKAVAATLAVPPSETASPPSEPL